VQRSPWSAGLATFFSFLAVGLIPLLPFLIPVVSGESSFLVSIVLTGLGFAGIGVAKGIVLGRQIWRSSIETLFTGGAAAVVAYVVGFWLRQAFGTS
jgi:vacuolar iron transporter family protein